MPYIQERIYDESELGLSGVSDWLKRAGGWLKEGAKQELLGKPQAPPAYVPPPEKSFMEKAAPILLIGGAGLVIYLIVRSKKK